MLTSVDRVLVVVRDREAATDTWRDIFGAEKVGEARSRALNSHITTVQAGTSEFDLLEPAGDGPVAEFASRWGEGLFGAGFTTPSLLDAVRHLGSEVVKYAEEKDRIYIAGDQTSGMPTVITEERERTPVGNIRHLYEVTNPVADWQDTAALYTRIFALDPVRFSPIKSDLYGYEGTLTLFDPPNRLDRIEVTQTWDGKAMDRFFQRRGPGLYMCYVETDDVMGLAERLKARGARFAQSEDRPPETGLFIHPTALHGMLMGVSLTNYAWVWSGRPELAGPGAAAGYRGQ
jgi:catechol 2,3-dioxygenase-like lactoylglutathione lyase family enzyme